MSTPTADKRRNPRIPIADLAPRVRVSMQSTKGLNLGSEDVRVVDLSRKGLGFISAKPVEVGARCSLLIARRSETLRVIARVVNCRKAPGGEAGHIVGVRFSSLARLPDTNPNAPLTEHPVIEQLVADL